MIPRLLPTLILTTLVIAGGCRSRQPAALSKHDRASLAWATETWERAANAKDFATLAGLYTDDALLLPPNHEPIRGRVGIQEYVAAYPAFSDMRLSPAEVDGRGDVAYVWGAYSMMLTPPGSVGPVPERGKYVEIWRRQPDGWWRITHNIFNSNLPAASAVPTTRPSR